MIPFPTSGRKENLGRRNTKKEGLAKFPEREQKLQRKWYGYEDTRNGAEASFFSSAVEEEWPAVHTAIEGRRLVSGIIGRERACSFGQGKRIQRTIERKGKRWGRKGQKKEKVPF